MKYRTRTRLHFLRRYSLLIITVLILALAATAVFAAKPPQALFDLVTSTAKLVHRGSCKLPQKQVKETPCIMYHDEGRKLIYMVLFAQKNSEHYVTHVYVIDDKDEVTTLWTHPNLTV